MCNTCSGCDRSDNDSDKVTFYKCHRCNEYYCNTCTSKCDHKKCNTTQVCRHCLVYCGDCNFKVCSDNNKCKLVLSVHRTLHNK